jgi:predicted nucleic acid-binding protein
MRYVFDNSALSELLRKCGLIECMKLFSKENELLVPERVKEEFLRNDPPPESVSILEDEFRLIEVEPDDRILPYFHFDSTSGEFWVLSYGINDPEAICVIDEGKARTVAKHENITIIGTVKLLEILRDGDSITRSELDETKRIILAGDFRLSPALREQLDSL